MSPVTNAPLSSDALSPHQEAQKEIGAETEEGAEGGKAEKTQTHPHTRKKIPTPHPILTPGGTEGG